MSESCTCRISMVMRICLRRTDRRRPFQPETVAQRQRMAETPAHIHHGATVSPFNPPSLAAFLAWFGGAGYLLTRFSALWVGTALSLSVLAGLWEGPSSFSS